MRICVVSGTFHPEPGGPPAFLFRLLPALQQRGFKIHVVTYGEANSQRYPYAVTRVSRRYPLPVRLILFALEVWRHGRNADLFFVSDYGLPVAAVNLFLRKPVVLKNVGDFAWEFSTRRGWIPSQQSIDDFQTASHSWRVNMLRAAQRWHTARANIIIAPSRYSASIVAGWKIDPQKIHVIYNALDPVEALPGRAEARRSLGIGQPTIVTVARLAPWKGVDGLIHAFGRLLPQFPSLRLMVVGDGPERSKLERLAGEVSDQIEFVGAQPPQQVWQYLCAADVFALFSTYEGLPHTVLEAMQAGTPVVVSDAGGNTEVVTDGKTGQVVPVGNTERLADAIAGLLGNPARAQHLAAEAKTHLSRFSWDALVEQYSSAIQNALG